MAYEDLLKDTSKPDPDNKDYFLLTVTDLDPGKTYPIQLRWVYKNDKAAKDQEWSAVKNLTTPSESLSAPQFQSSDLVADGFNLIVKWSGLDAYGNTYTANLDRIDIYIRGGQFGGTSVYSGKSFKKAGTQTFSFNTADTYYVKLKAVSKRGTESAFSTEIGKSTYAPVIVDTQGPANVNSVGLGISAGIDNSGAIGFNGYLDLSWSAVSDTTLRGYRIRFRTGASNYSYADSPGTGTTYRLRGLAVGATYEVGIATYDELNNTSSSYTSFTSTAIGGTPFVGTNVNTTGYFSAGTSPNDFQFGYGIDSANNSDTFAGTKRGLYFTPSNYWVIDSSQTAKFKLGGLTSNYVQWKDNILSVDGNIAARGGSFSGNILMSSTNASIYNVDSLHTINSDGTLPAGSTGFVLNGSGLNFRYNGTDKVLIKSSDGTVQVTGTIQTTGGTYGNVKIDGINSTISLYDTSGTGRLHMLPNNTVPGFSTGSLFHTKSTADFSLADMSTYVYALFGATSMSFNAGNAAGIGIGNSVGIILSSTPSITITSSTAVEISGLTTFYTTDSASFIGRNIGYGTGSPSGGSNGDVWLTYTA